MSTMYVSQLKERKGLQAVGKYSPVNMNAIFNVKLGNTGCRPLITNLETSGCWAWKNEVWFWLHRTNRMSSAHQIPPTVNPWQWLMIIIFTFNHRNSMTGKQRLAKLTVQMFSTEKSTNFTFKYVCTIPMALCRNII